jgi:hypothetical protein
MLRIPFKMDWSQSFPPARKVRKTLDPEAWERLANPKLIRFLATMFIIPGYIVALLLIIMALCNGIMSAPPAISPPVVHTPAALVPSGTRTVALAGVSGRTSLIMAGTPMPAGK